MKLSTVPGLNIGNKNPVYAPRIEGTLGITKRNVADQVNGTQMTRPINPLDKTPPQKSAREGEKPHEISAGLWSMLKAGKLDSSLGHPPEGGFKSRKSVGGAYFGSKKK